MIINWLAAKAQHFLPTLEAEPDEHELSISFDFALSAEFMGLHHAQNLTRLQTLHALDEHELALV